jgi:hypothetical protein
MCKLFTCLLYGCDNGFYILKEEHGLVLLGEVGEKGVKNGSERFLNFYWLLYANVII